MNAERKMVAPNIIRTALHRIEDGLSPLWPRLTASLLTIFAEGAGSLDEVVLPKTRLALSLPTLDAGPTHILCEM